MGHVALRQVADADLDTLFKLDRDPQSRWMAAFTSPDRDDRAAFGDFMARLRASPDVVQRAIVRDGVLVGSIGSWVADGETELTYWIDRAVWGQGIASRALALFLDEVTVRPLRARAASDNVGSLRVLAKAGFRVVGTEVAYAHERRAEIEETVLRLD